MRSEVSSRWTFFAKVIFPLSFMIFFLSGIFPVWLGKAPPTNNEISLPSLKYLTLAYPLVFVWFSIFLFGGLKRLHVDKDNLYISNYLKEIVVPIRKIKNVEERIGLKLKPTKICFYESTGFGTEIVFIPRGSFLPWRRSLVVAELRKLAELPDF